MKRLLGIIKKHNQEQLLVQSGSFVGILDESQKNDFKVYSILSGQKESKSITGELFNFRLGPLSGASLECGTYNIYTYGERMVDVDIDISYKSRGIENLMCGKNTAHALTLSENVCANFAFSHSVAFSRAIEEAYKITISDYCRFTRLILIEVERIYNHIFVISRLAMAAAQKVYASHLVYLFEDLLSLNKKFFQSRFLKGINKIGSIYYLPISQIKIFVEQLDKIVNEFLKIYEFSLKSVNYLDRLHNTGVLTINDFDDINFDGPALKAIGYYTDIRQFESDFDFKPIVETDGDSLARMIVRAKEVQQSLNIIKSLLEKFKKDSLELDVNIYDDSKTRIGIGQCESPSGTITYYVELVGNIIDYVYISTPSMFLFNAIEKALKGQIFTDFAFTVDSFGAFFADAAK